MKPARNISSALNVFRFESGELLCHWCFDVDFDDRAFLRAAENGDRCRDCDGVYSDDLGRWLDD